MSEQAKNLSHDEELMPDVSGQDLSAYQGLRIVEDNVAAAPADFRSRVLAFTIDSIISQALIGLAAAILTNALHAPSKSWISSFAGLMIRFGYFFLQTFNNGQTIGKKVMKIRVVPDSGGDLLEFRQAFLRETIGLFLSLMIGGLGFLGAYIREDKKSLQDQWFKTRVVKVN